MSLHRRVFRSERLEGLRAHGDHARPSRRPRGREARGDARKHRTDRGHPAHRRWKRHASPGRPSTFANSRSFQACHAASVGFTARVENGEMMAPIARPRFSLLLPYVPSGHLASLSVSLALCFPCLFREWARSLVFVKKRCTGANVKWWRCVLIEICMFVLVEADKKKQKNAPKRYPSL